MPNYIKKISSSISKNTKSNKKQGNRTNHSQNNTSYKEIKRLPIIAKICIIFCFIIGICSSYIVSSIMCKNDKFEMNGKKSIVLYQGDTYIDDGVTIVAFGKDISKDAIIEIYKGETKIKSLSEIQTNNVGDMYQIIYSTKSNRFKETKLIRKIFIEETPTEIEVEEDEIQDK